MNGGEHARKGRSADRIRCLLFKELAQIRRDRRLLAILLVAPVIQLTLLGYAATTDVRQIRLGIRDQDHSHYSREYARALSASDYFQVTRLSGSPRDDDARLVSGRLGLIAVIPSDFGARLSRGEPVAVQVLVDGADSNFAVHGLNYLQKATRLFSERLVRDVAAGTAGAISAVPALVVESRAWFNPDLRSRFYMVPGVMGLLLLVTTMLVTSMTLVKEREDGTMEQIIVTPLRPRELVAGKLLPFVLIGFIEVTLALAVTLAVFRVPLRGSALTLYLLSGLFLLTTLGLGLFISTLVRTQQQAMLVAAFFVMMPFALLSGFIFPVENMPAPIQALTAFIPLKYYLEIVRGIFLKGVGLSDLWPDALALLVFGAVILTLAVMKFHKRLD
jgi:ABC-2 type transport system permease protein